MIVLRMPPLVSVVKDEKGNPFDSSSLTDCV